MVSVHVHQLRTLQHAIGQVEELIRQQVSPLPRTVLLQALPGWASRAEISH